MYELLYTQLHFLWVIWNNKGLKEATQYGVDSLPEL